MACHSIITVLTPPDSVTVVFSSDEWSFSNLKLIKTHLRCCVTQERLSDLGLLSIERERFKDIDRNAIARKCAKLFLKQESVYFSLVDVMTATVLAEVSYVLQM